jgi:membrane-associated protein
MEILQHLLDWVLHLDAYLISFVADHGTWTYLLAFAVIFCETGLVVTPFLPGDSLIFTLGSIAAYTDNPLNILTLLFLLIVASILGNQLNYFIGRFIGPRVFSMNQSRLFNKKHLEKAHQFYEKHGGKTIIMARFIPIIRTFAPFVAGISYMTKARFHAYNISSAILWIGSLLGLGYFLGSLPVIKEHFSIVIYGIIIVSFMPPLVSLLYKKLFAKQ